jgi:hypothetical protein
MCKVLSELELCCRDRTEQTSDDSRERTNILDISRHIKRPAPPPPPTAPPLTPPSSPNHHQNEIPIPAPRLSLLKNTKILPPISSQHKNKAPLPPIKQRLSLPSVENESLYPVIRTKELSQRIKNDLHDDNCIICMEKVANSCFYNCGHIIACFDCAIGIKSCPTCRKDVMDVIKVYRN